MVHMNRGGFKLHTLENLANYWISQTFEWENLCARIGRGYSLENFHGTILVA